jgi:hypothetical protein
MIENPVTVVKTQRRRRKNMKASATEEQQNEKWGVGACTST